MRYDPALEPARLLRRYKRFLADVELPGGDQRTVHCANPGAMTGLLTEGAPCWISDSRNPKRRLRYSLELVEADGTWVSVNTARTNGLVDEALDRGAIPELVGATERRREVTAGDSRIDFKLVIDGRHVWVEVKQTTMARPPLGRFPDAPTVRGRKHLAELRDRVAAGQRAALLFVATRGDLKTFAPADDIDPGYGTTLRDVHAAGVEVLAYGCRVDPRETVITAPLALRL